MAQEPLMRDPKSGRMLSRFETTVRRAQLDAESLGQKGLDKEFTEFASRQGDDTDNVQKYVTPMMDVVRNYGGPAVQLRKVLPLLKEIITLADEDPTLTKAEKTRIQAAHATLAQFIQRKSAVLTRVGSRLKSFAKDKLPDARASVSQGLQNSQSGMAKLAGKVLAPRDKEDIKQSMMDARASVYGQALEARKAHKEKQKVSKERVIPDMDEPTKPRKTRKVSDDEGDTPSSTSASDLLSEILGVNQEMLRKIEVTNQLLRTGREDMIQQEDEKERAAKTKVAKVGTTPATVKDKSKGFLESLLPIGLLDGVKNAFGSILKWFGPGSVLASMVMPAITALGTAAAVIGAAWLGWKVGDWISQLMGLGSSSEALAKLMDGSQSALETAKSAWKGITGGKAKETAGAKEDTIKAARAHAREMGGEQKGFNQPNTMADAVAMNNRWSEWKKAQVKKTTQATLPAGRNLSMLPTVTGRSLPEEKPVGKSVAKIDANPMTSPNAPTVEKVKPEAFNYDAYAAQLGQRESSNNYQAENGLGYLGKYQMGVMALEDAGLLKPGTSKLKGGQKTILANPSNWTIPGGKLAFLKNAALQEQVMKGHTNRNLSTLKRLKMVNASTSGGDMAGLLAASHLVGVGGVKKSMETKDANGVSARNYFDMAANAQRGPSDRRNAAPVMAMNNARGASGGPKIIIAPQQTVRTNNTQTHTIVPLPVVTSNPDQTVRAIKSVNTV